MCRFLPRAAVVVSFGFILLMTGWGLKLFAQEKQQQPSWNEAALVKMGELGLDSETIIAQLKRRAWKFEVNDGLLNRLEKSGLPKEVLQFLRKSAQPAAEGVAENLMVWAKRDSAYHEASLHSELWINGARVERFTSDTQKSVHKFFRPGWNDIMFKTTPQATAKRLNLLEFHFGPVVEGTNGKPVMTRLFRFINGSDWSFKQGRHRHLFGPEVQDATVQFRVYYAPDGPADASLKQGDFVLRANADSDYRNTSVSVTVWLNGTPITSFVGLDRAAVVTSLLRQGRNEIKIVAQRVKNSATNNEVYVSLTGHALFNRRAQKFEVKPILQLQGMFAFERNQTSLELKCRLDPQSETVERVIPFYLMQDPRSQRITTDHAMEPTMMVWTDRDSDYREASLHSELRINGRLVDVFTSNTRKSIEPYLKQGVNVVTLITTPQAGATRKNELRFTIGMVARDKKDKMVMTPLWKFYNGTDWSYKNGNHVHILGNDVKEQQITMRLHYAGAERLARQVGKGDYVLRCAPDSAYRNSTTTITVYVNGTPLNTFDKHKRQTVITDLLKPGHNELRIVSHLIEGSVARNNLNLAIGGPAQFKLKSQKYELPLVLRDVHGLEGWKQALRTLKWESQTSPGANKVERVIPFTVEKS